MNARIPALKGGQDRDNVVGRIRADAKLSRNQLPCRDEQLLRLCLDPEQALGDLEHRAPEFSQLNAAAAALEQLDAVALLELLDVGGQSGLGHVKNFRGAGVAAMGRNCIERTEVGVIDRHTLYTT